MSLDERLRSGLRTMAEPVQDSERALYAFKEKAYPRRAHRRVFEVVGSVLAAAAIVIGGTAVVHNLSNRPAPFASRPPGIPTCTNDNLQIYAGSGGGQGMEIETSLTAVRQACWIDEKIRLTIKPSGSSDQPSAQPLQIQGNGSTIHVVGVVPVGQARPAAGSSVLGARWEWTNWCGSDHNPSFEFRPLSQGYTYIYKMDGASTHATCVDPSKPSELRSLGQATEMLDASQPTG